jgi:hypothetical protein
LRPTRAGRWHAAEQPADMTFGSEFKLDRWHATVQPADMTFGGASNPSWKVSRGQAATDMTWWLPQRCRTACRRWPSATSLRSWKGSHCRAACRHDVRQRVQPEFGRWRAATQLADTTFGYSPPGLGRCRGGEQHAENHEVARSLEGVLQPCSLQAETFGFALNQPKRGGRCRTSTLATSSTSKVSRCRVGVLLLPS